MATLTAPTLSTSPATKNRSSRSKKRHGSRPPAAHATITPATSPPTPQHLLPEEQRRPLSSRIDDVLAHPRARRCHDECSPCAALPEESAQAALELWDVQARSGVWPVKNAEIRAALAERGIVIDRSSLRRLVEHRRFLPLNDLVRRELDASERESATVRA